MLKNFKLFWFRRNNETHNADIFIFVLSGVLKSYEAEKK